MHGKYYKCLTTQPPSLKRCQWLRALSASFNKRGWGKPSVLRQPPQHSCNQPLALAHRTLRAEFPMLSLVSHYLWVKHQDYHPLLWSLLLKKKVLVLRFLSWNTFKSLKMYVLHSEKNPFRLQTGLPGGSDGKASTCSAGDPGSTPGSGRSPERGNGNPLQYSCLGNPMDREAWQATVHGVTKSRTRMSD